MAVYLSCVMDGQEKYVLRWWAEKKELRERGESCGGDKERERAVFGCREYKEKWP